MQFKTTMRYHLMHVRMAISINQQTTSAGEVVEKGEPFYTVGGSADWFKHCGSSMGILQTIKNGSAVDSVIPLLEISIYIYIYTHIHTH